MVNQPLMTMIPGTGCVHRGKDTTFLIWNEYLGESWVAGVGGVDLATHFGLGKRPNGDAE